VLCGVCVRLVATFDLRHGHGRGYLDEVSQQLLERLVASVAQEAVRVQGVVAAVQTQLHDVALVLHPLLRHERDLRRGSAQIERPDRGSVGGQPAAHETVLAEREGSILDYEIVSLPVGIHEQEAI